MGEDLKATVGPDHGERVDLHCTPEAEVQTRIDGRLEAARRHLLQQLLCSVVLENNLGTDARCILSRAPEHYLQVMIAVERARPVAVDRGRGVDLVHDEIQGAAVIQVDIDGAVRESLLPQTPRVRHVRERQIAVVMEGDVGDGDVRHLPDQCLTHRSHVLCERRLHRGRAHVREIVEVIGATIHPGGDEQVLVAVVVQIGEQRRPAPVGCIHARQVADLAEAVAATIELERVAGVLRMIAGLQLQVVDVPAFRVLGCLEDFFLVGKHVGDDHVGPAIVVEIGRIDAHRRVTRVADGCGNGLGERAVAVVVVEKIVFLEIIRDVEIGTAVAVQVARHDAQTVSLHATIDVGLVAHVDKVTAVVSIQAIARARVTRHALRVHAARPLGVHGVIQHIHVQIPVAVVVEEQRLGAVADVVESVLARPVGERAVAIIDEEHVAAVHREVIDAGDVDVDIAVAVHVGHRHAGLPALGIGHAGVRGDVLEVVIASVQVEPVGSDVRREVEIGKAVVIDVADGDTTAVVVVQVVEDVEGGVIRQAIHERHAGGFGWQGFEERRARRWSGGSLAAGEQDHQRAMSPFHRFVTGRMRIACPPPGASASCRCEPRVTVRCAIVTGSGFVSQFAPGPSA